VSDEQPTQRSDEKGSDEKEKSPSRLLKFFTGVPGFMAGLATVVTATAAITTVLIHSDSSATGSPPNASPGARAATDPAAPTSLSPSASTADNSSSSTRLWGPAALVLTNDGTDLHSIPPISDALNGSPDVYDGGSGLAPMNQSILVVWTGSSSPTPQECLDLIRTQAIGASVSVTTGTTVCIETSENTLAVVRVTEPDFDGSDYDMMTQTTIYAIPTG
jgi:hypothetical protein